MGSFLNYGKANQCIVSPWQGRFGLGLLSQYFQGGPSHVLLMLADQHAGISTNNFNNSTAQ
jgi:hypothetical protein